MWRRKAQIGLFFTFLLAMLFIFLMFLLPRIEIAGWSPLAVKKTLYVTMQTDEKGGAISSLLDVRREETSYSEMFGNLASRDIGEESARDVRDILDGMFPDEKYTLEISFPSYPDEKVVYKNTEVSPPGDADIYEFGIAIPGARGEGTAKLEVWT
jgi:hypothetical protein